MKQRKSKMRYFFQLLNNILYIGLHAVTPAADWWSLGAVLFYLMSGHTLSHFYPYHAIRSTIPY